MIKTDQLAKAMAEDFPEIKIPMHRLDRMYDNLKEELQDAVNDVVKSGIHANGSKKEEFEKEIAEMCGRNFAIAVSSATSGLHIAGKAFAKWATKKDNGGYDNVLTNAFTHSSTYCAFTDTVIKSNTNRGVPVKYISTDANYQFDVNELPVDGSRNVIVFSNMFGNTINWSNLTVNNTLSESDSFIIEDAAQSFGAVHNEVPSGKMGHISVLSFDPTKGLPNFGNGGMILTDSGTLYYYLRGIAGSNTTVKNNGYNSSMSERDCAEMSVKLRHFPKWQERRKQIAEYYTSRIYTEIVNVDKYRDLGIKPLGTTEGTTHAWSKFPVVFKSHYHANKLSYQMAHKSIQTKTCNYSGNTAGDLAPLLLLPIYPEMTDSEVEHVIDSFRESCDKMTFYSF